MGLSRLALAKQAGISHGHLRDVETGRIRDPGVSVVQALAQALGVTVDALLREDPQDSPGGPQPAAAATRGQEAAEAPQEAR